MSGDFFEPVREPKLQPELTRSGSGGGGRTAVGQGEFDDGDEPKRQGPLLAPLLLHRCCAQGSSFQRLRSRRQ